MFSRNGVAFLCTVACLTPILFYCCYAILHYCCILGEALHLTRITSKWPREFPEPLLRNIKYYWKEAHVQYFQCLLQRAHQNTKSCNLRLHCMHSTLDSMYISAYNIACTLLTCTCTYLLVPQKIFKWSISMEGLEQQSLGCFWHDTTCCMQVRKHNFMH